MPGGRSRNPRKRGGHGVTGGFVAHGAYARGHTQAKSIHTHRPTQRPEYAVTPSTTTTRTTTFAGRTKTTTTTATTTEVIPAEYQ